MNFYDVDPPVIFEAYNPVDWFLVDEHQTDKCIFPRGLQENLRQKKYIVLYAITHDFNFEFNKYIGLIEETC